jgi:DNA-binding transcriptional ArsR family regulator
MKKNELYQKLFLRELVKMYGYIIQETYKDMAQKLGGINYGTVRNHLIALEAAKVLKIENKSKYNQVYHLDRKKVTRIINTHES